MIRIHIKGLFDFGEKRARIGVLGFQIGEHSLALVGVHDATVSEIKPDGSTKWASASLWTDLYPHNAIEFLPPRLPSRSNWKRPNRTDGSSEKVGAKISMGPPGMALPETIS